MMPVLVGSQHGFPIADLSQSHPVPCLPALFIYSRLFLSG